MNLNKLSINKLIGIFIFALLGPLPTAEAWGPLGHRIAGYIAQERLDPDVRQLIQDEYKISNLADVANWADRVKKKRNQKPWHYTNIPRGQSNYLKRRDCPDGNCVTEVIPKFIREMTGPEVSKRKRKEALMYLVHFVADAHQPFHLGYEDDKGGNEIKVRYKRKWTNLHALWDSKLIPRSAKRPLRYAQKLNRKITRAEERDWLKTTPLDWCLESRSLFLKFGYPEGGNRRKLSRRYIRKGQEIIEERLVQAGVRLADVLNRSLGN